MASVSQFVIFDENPRSNFDQGITFIALGVLAATVAWKVTSYGPAYWIAAIVAGVLAIFGIGMLVDTYSTNIIDADARELRLIKTSLRKTVVRTFKAEAIEGFVCVEEKCRRDDGYSDIATIKHRLIVNLKNGEQETIAVSETKPADARRQFDRMFILKMQSAKALGLPL